MAAKERTLSFILGANINSAFNNAFKTATSWLTQTRVNLGGVVESEDRVRTHSQHMSSGFGGAIEHMSSGAKDLLHNLLGLGAGYLSLEGVKTAYDELTKASDDAEKAQADYLTLMGKAPGVTLAQKNALSGYADQLGKSTLVGRNVVKEGMAQLATFHLTAEQIKQLTPAMLDLTVRQNGVNVGTEGMMHTANMLGKVFTGQVGALKRVGISFDATEAKIMKTGTQSQKTATLARVLEENFGGVNKALAKTRPGQIVMLTHTLEEMKERLAGIIMPFRDKFIGYLSDHLPQIERLATNVLTGIQDTIRTLLPYITEIGSWFVTAFNNVRGSGNNLMPALNKVGQVLKQAFAIARPPVMWLITIGLPKFISFAAGVLHVAASILGFFTGNWKVIGPLVYGVAGAFLFFKGVMLALSIASKIMTAVQWLLNIAMDANPIGLIVLGVGLLIAGFVLLALHFREVIAWIKKFGVYFLVALGPVGWEWILIIKNFGKIKKVLGEVCTAIKNAFLSLFNWLKGQWEAMMNSPAVKAFVGIAEKVGQSVKDAWNHVTHGGKSPAPGHHAGGGLVSSPQLSWLGEGGKPELVLPLTNRPRTQQLLQTAGLSTAVGRRGDIHINQTFQVSGGGDAKQIAQRTATISKNELRRMLIDLMRDEQRVSYAGS